MPLKKDAVSQIYPFAQEAQEGTGQLMPLDSYKEDSQRKGGMSAGIASRARFNRALRQSAHVSAGLAQFIANRHTPGVLDDSDLDKIEQGLFEVIDAMIADTVVPRTLDYFLCWHPFFGLSPKAKPGMMPCMGGLIADAKEQYPQAWEYLLSEEGK